MMGKFTGEIRQDIYWEKAGGVISLKITIHYKKLSPEKIRQHLISVQTSILFDTKKRIRYGLPSRMSQEARKIYQVQAIERRITPYIINKL